MPSIDAERDPISEQTEDDHESDDRPLPRFRHVKSEEPDALIAAGQLDAERDEPLREQRDRAEPNEGEEQGLLPSRHGADHTRGSLLDRPSGPHQLEQFGSARLELSVRDASEPPGENHTSSDADRHSRPAQGLVVQHSAG